MKKQVLLVMMMAVSLGIMAQGNADREDLFTARMKSELSLNDAQYAQLRSINQAFMADQRKLNADTSMSRGKYQTERKKLIADRQEKIKKVLTEDQYEKWTAKTRPHPQNARADRRTRNPMEDLKSSLGVSDEQARKIMLSNREMAEAYRKLQSDSISSPDERKAAVEELRKERNAKVRKFLNDEQYSNFVKYEAERSRYRRGGARPMKR